MEEIKLQKTKKLKKLKLKADALKQLSGDMSKNFYSMGFKKSLRLHMKIYKEYERAHEKLWKEVYEQAPEELKDKSLILREKFGELYLKLQEDE